MAQTVKKAIVSIEIRIFADECPVVMTNKTQQKKFEAMTTLPVDRLVRHMAFPTVVSMLITAMYNIADAFFVGQLGASATGAIGIVYSLMAIIQAIGFGLGHGSGNYISRKLGERHVHEASIMATVGFVTSFLLGGLVMVVGIFNMPRLAMFLGSTPTIRPYAEEYLLYILLGAPFFASSLTLNNQLRLQGSAKKAMIGIASGAVINCLLDPLLIFGFGMGVAGAGLSTLISQVLSFAILVYQTQYGDVVSLRLHNFRPTKARYIAIIQGGMPSTGRQGVHCLGNILMNHAMKMFGDNFFAAMTIVIRLSNFIFAGTAGIGQGFQPVCGFNYGARRFDRVRKAYIYTQKMALCFLGTLTAVLFIFARPIMGLFSDEAGVVELGVQVQRWQCVSIPFMGYCIIISMLLQNINKYKQATIIALSRSGIFFVPAILVFPYFFGMFGVIIAQPISDLCSFATALPMQKKVIRELNAYSS